MGLRKRISSILLIVCAAGILLPVLSNNFSLNPVSREEFVRQLEGTMALGRVWTEFKAKQVMGQPNCFLLHMIEDMADMSGETGFYRITAGYLKQSAPSLWNRLIDEHAAIRPVTPSESGKLEDYQRWTLYALAPDQFSIAPDEKKQMFSENEHHWGSLTHQLISLYVYRKYQKADADELISHLCERIAFEALWDIRVTDLYLQRVSFILAAGRADLIRPRWVERIIANQEPDGGWTSDWYGWGPDLFRFRFKKQGTNAHTSIQGLWALYMLKYRYPEWIEQHYN